MRDYESTAKQVSLIATPGFPYWRKCSQVPCQEWWYNSRAIYNSDFTMDDLSGLDWSSTSQPQTTKQQHALPTLTTINSIPRNASPFSAKAQTLSSLGNGVRYTTAKSTGLDSFSGLLGSASSKTPSASMSLQERQKLLIAEKTRQAARNDTAYSPNDASFWNELGSGRASPAVVGSVIHSVTGMAVLTCRQRSQTPAFDDTDILAAFNASAPVDKSSHFPVPASSHASSNTASRDVSSHPNAEAPETVFSNNNGAGDYGGFDEDDDPFGLGQLEQGRRDVAPRIAPGEDNDDILGMLGRPVSELPPKHKVRPLPEQSDSTNGRSRDNKHDKALAELVDMGFPIEKSREALLSTPDGIGVQAAVGYLLNQAHSESQSRSSNRTPDSSVEEVRGRTSRQAGANHQEHSRDSVPAWMKSHGTNSRTESQSSASSEKDVSQYASEIGASLFKSAGSLWKTGQKKVQRVVADLQQDDAGSQPKWMRETQESVPKPVRRQDESITDEAARLEGGRDTSRRTAQPPRADTRFAASDPIQRRPSPLVGMDLPQRRASPLTASHVPDRIPTSRATAQPNTLTRPAERLSRQAVEEQSAQAYISPARRKKAVEKQPERQPELDIFSDTSPSFSVPTKSQSQSLNTQASSHSTSAPSRSSTPLAVRPKIQARPNPPISSAAMTTSTTQRRKGNEAFKRGDYAEAHTCYTAALTPLPATHSITIVLRCNRALTSLKTGDPKAAIGDADAVISAIGPSHGDGESIDLGEGGDPKPMKEYYGKALMRKAEALEHMEKWTDAAAAWRAAVEAGVGGAVSIQGRNRTEKAAGGSNPVAASAPARAASAPPRPTPAKKTVPAGRPAAVNRLNGAVSAAETEAVKRLRAANAAAAAASDEAFALTDAVDAKLGAWKAGKSDNLRALLSSLDGVLWPEAGWKKVGLADLVMPNRVKVVYMRAIAKVHPDKVSLWGRGMFGGELRPQLTCVCF